MAKKMIACRTCGEQIAASAKTCPKCGAKNKKPIYKKWWFYVLVLLILAGLGGSGARKNGTVSANTTSVTSTSSGSKQTESKTDETAATPEPISYEHYNVTELFGMLKSNAMKAQNTFKDQHVELEGFLGTIDSNGKYIGLGAASDKYEYMLQEVQCYIKSDEQREIIMELNRGDPIIVRGKITRIGEVLGYSLDIESVESK